ncbi:MAG: hypothetical protein ACRDQZ_11750, partial [Mycobacteriales bacterium]
GGAAPMSNETLQSERAGFFDAGGQEFGFAATLATTVNGQLALITTLTLQDDGTVTKDTVVNSEIINGDNLPGGPSIVIPVNGAQQLADALSGTNVDLNGLSATGLVIKSNSGVTAVLDNVTANQLQNLVINTANGQNIVQNTSVTLTLPVTELSGLGLSQVMNGITNALQVSQLGH